MINVVKVRYKTEWFRIERDINTGVWWLDQNFEFKSLGEALGWLLSQ